MVKNGCGQSGGRTLKPAVSEEWLDGRTDFLHVDTNSGKLKVDSMTFGWMWPRFVSSWDPKFCYILRMNL